MKNWTKTEVLEYTKAHMNSLMYLALYLIVAPIYGLLNHSNGHPLCLELPLDRMIPMVKEFILVYHSWYPFLILCLVYLFFHDNEHFEKACKNLFISQALAYCVFLTMQTYVPRPTLIGNDFFTNLVRLTYRADNFYNGFPSVHVLTTVIVAYYMLKSRAEENIKSWTLIYAVLILLSTLFVKQHFVLDIVGGCVVALIGRYWAESLYLEPVFEKIFKKVNKNY